MAVASLILGLVALVFSFVPGVEWIGTITGLVGIILGAIARKNPEKRGLATGGLVCSIIGFILSIILYIACVACIGTAALLAS